MARQCNIYKKVAMHVPDCGMAFATLAAAERLLVLGEPVGALLVVSYKQQLFLSHIQTLQGGLNHLKSQNVEGKKRKGIKEQRALTTGRPAVAAGCLASSDCKLEHNMRTHSNKHKNKSSNQDHRAIFPFVYQQTAFQVALTQQKCCLTCSFTRNTWSSSA